MELTIKELNYAEVKSLKEMTHHFQGIADYSGKESLKSACQKVQNAIRTQTHLHTEGGETEAVIQNVMFPYQK